MRERIVTHAEQQRRGMTVAKIYLVKQVKNLKVVDLAKPVKARFVRRPDVIEQAVKNAKKEWKQ